MNPRHALMLSCLLACAPAAPAPASKPAAGAPQAGKAPAFPRTSLGRVAVAGVELEVFQLEPIVAGGPGDFDLDFAPGVPFPPAIRGWVGLESGEGSVKVRFEKETATRMHGHPELPKPLPAGSRFWLEVEGADGKKVKVSVAVKL